MAAHRACGKCQLASSEYGDVDGVGAVEGFCNETSTGQHGDCERGDKGSWRIGEGNLTDVAACVRRCVDGCARCRYVSVSIPERDCSWYATCDVRRLRNAGLGHRTYAVDALRSGKGAGGGLGGRRHGGVERAARRGAMGRGRGRGGAGRRGLARGARKHHHQRSKAKGF